MSLIKRNPTKELELWNQEFPVPRMISHLQQEMNKVFGDFFRGDLFDGGSFLSGQWTPAVDLEETDDSYVVRAELPGIKKDEVKITLNDGVVTVSGEKRNEVEKKEGNYHRVERSYGAFERSFTLPGAVKSDEIEAKYADGVLTITLPKTEEAKEKIIEVKVK
ncbi:MAG TPA: Hsp20/alpha crystallin family protein [Bacteroidota bacterium]|nr:Hsp20/alpha crystallin family protein [Bacteroidota bacterium]